MEIALKVKFIMIENQSTIFYIYVGTNYRNTHEIKIYYYYLNVDVNTFLYIIKISIFG